MEEANDIKWTENVDEKKIVFENILIPSIAAVNTPGKVVLRYTVEIEDYSSSPNVEKEDIWQHAGMKLENGTASCLLVNAAHAYWEKEGEYFTGAVCSVEFTNQLIEKKFDERAANGNPKYEIKLNMGDSNHNKESRYNMSGWTVRDRLSNSGKWKVVPESVKIYYYDEYVESADVETGRHLAANTGLKMVDTSGECGFDYTIPESLGMKYIIIQYEVCNRDETVPGQIQYLWNDVTLDGIPGVPNATYGTWSRIVTASVLSKNAVSYNGQEIRWRSEVGTNIKNGMKYYDWVEEIMR